MTDVLPRLPSAATAMKLGETGNREVESRPFDLQRALIDPAAWFQSPDDVALSADLPLADKIEILCRWAYETAELAVAEEEGMDGGESDDMSAVLTALDRIMDVDVQHSAPTKHAGFCVGRDVR